LKSRTYSDLGNRLRAQGVSLAELFSHTSTLYFRGKLAYGRFFARAPAGFEGCYVITSSRGLLPPDTVVDIEVARELASGAEIDLEDDRYRIPLRRDAAALEKALPDNCHVVLLGSVATEKYVTPLSEVFGRRLLFPSAFVGRGDMSRGGLLLRCVRENQELTYSPTRVNSHKGSRSWSSLEAVVVDPSIKRLAMQVEDHPIDYAGFEGVFPRASTGAGPLWSGTAEHGSQKATTAKLRSKGDLKFTLQGEKLRGSWALVRTRRFGSKTDKSWLLIKHRDRFASTNDITSQMPRSAVSDRLLAEIAREEGGDVTTASAGDPETTTRQKSKVKRTAGRRGGLRWRWWRNIS
jgi:DNA ligase D-like protein (predicted 3'-phosphoesterase)